MIQVYDGDGEKPIEPVVPRSHGVTSDAVRLDANFLLTHRLASKYEECTSTLGQIARSAGYSDQVRAIWLRGIAKLKKRLGELRRSGEVNLVDLDMLDKTAAVLEHNL